MSKLPGHTEKYLRKNSCGYKIENLPENKSRCELRNAVVIPAFGEYSTLPKTLASLKRALSASDENTLVLIVVNNPPAEFCDSAKFAENTKTLQWLKDNIHASEKISWIDASSPGYEIPEKGGVGAARKLGMDAVLQFLDWKNEPLIFCLDSDTLAEENYLTASRNFFCEVRNSAVPAAYTEFSHRSGRTPEEEAAVRYYEAFMDDYVRHLRSSHSPYAYHAVGSTIICRAEAYVKSGGMRPKRAGEDFYFLQALRKLSPEGEIIKIAKTAVYPSSRISDRVPFGTGARMKELVEGDKHAYFYNPAIFAVLKKILISVNEGNLAKNPDTWYRKLPEDAQYFLDSYNFMSQWQSILRNTPDIPEKITWAFHVWFDAFRTLKFIHFCELRNPEQYGRIPVSPEDIQERQKSVTQY